MKPKQKVNEKLQVKPTSARKLDWVTSCEESWET